MAKRFQSVCGIALLAILLSACAKAPARPSPVSARVGALKSIQSAECMPPAIGAKLKTVWKMELPKLKAELATGAQGGVPTALYHAQGFINKLLDAAALCGDIEMLSSLTEYVAIPFDHLKKIDGLYTWADKKGTVVNTLSRSQFLYLVSRALHIISSLPENARTEAMNMLMAKAPVVAWQHYNKWAFSEPTFSVTAWGCRGSEQSGQKRGGRYYFKHSDFLRLKLEKRFKKEVQEPAYCNAVTDTDLWIVAGLVELLSARRNMPGIISLAEVEEKEVRGYFETAVSLIKSRISKTKLRNFAGKRVRGIVFDRGVWRDHPENTYSGYFGDSYPTPNDKKVSPGISWDISHARRFVNVFGTLFQNRDITGQEFPTEKTMRRLANQFAYAAFNKNLSHPLFNNFFDGNNGWYRVENKKGKRFGYGPYKLSNAGLTGGFGFWKRFNPDIAKINWALWRMINSTDPAVEKHVTRFYYSKDGKNYALLEFLPVFVRTAP